MFPIQPQTALPLRCLTPPPPLKRRRRLSSSSSTLWGDLHQPLHAGHSEDRGGNRIKVKFFGRDTNLHRLWDSGMIKQRRGNRRWDTYANGLNSAITPNDERSWGGAPSDWATESYKLALSNAYQVGNGQLGQDYCAANIGVVEEQIKKGGVRLR